MRYIGQGQAGGYTGVAIDDPFGSHHATYQTFHPDYGTVYGQPAHIPVVHGVGKQLVSKAPAKNSVKALQSFLRAKGYAIQVDGVRGPQTEAAAQAYQQGISARSWNTRSSHSSSPLAPKAPARPGAVPQPGRGKPSGGGKTVATGRGPVSRTTAPGSAPTTTTSTQMTAQQLAQQQVDAEFGPQEQAIQAQINARNQQLQQQLADIGTTYASIGQTANAVGDQTAQANAALLAEQQQGGQNMAQLFGGPGANSAAGEAASYASINDAELAQMAAADQSYNANLKPQIATAGAEAQAAANQQAGQDITGLQNDLTTLKGQRGAALTKYTSDIQQTQLENEQKQQALDLANRLAGPKYAKAVADAKKAGIDAKLAIPKFNASISKINAANTNRAIQNRFRYAEVFGVDPKTGQMTLAAKKAMKADIAKARGKPPTATTLDKWDKFAQDAYHGSWKTTMYQGEAKRVQTAPAMKYYPALKALMAKGATLAQAQRALNTYFGKGEAGRPNVSYQGRQALAQAGMPLAHTNDVPTQKQIDYLSKHGLWGD